MALCYSCANVSDDHVVIDMERMRPGVYTFILQDDASHRYITKLIIGN
jgi:hypothetical protein